MLKLFRLELRLHFKLQPPSGGCVLKPVTNIARQIQFSQPPSGGCVLKHPDCPQSWRWRAPAAFRRLCVETSSQGTVIKEIGPAAFRRLCVETLRHKRTAKPCRQPPSGGCVLKPGNRSTADFKNNPAAFRRLCVETLPYDHEDDRRSQPPSGGCVLKP